MPKANVLFLCTGNSCRSQMAEGWLRHIAGERFAVFSAGIKPVGVNPLAIEVMREIGIDISAHRSKQISELLGQNFSCVITVCDNAREQCPIFPGIFQRLHWSLNDPAAFRGSEHERRAVFRRVRDKIGERVREFVRSTTSEAAHQ